MSDAIQMQKEWSFAKTHHLLTDLHCRVSVGLVHSVQQDFRGKTGSVAPVGTARVRRFQSLQQETVLTRTVVQDQERELAIGQSLFLLRTRILPATADHCREEKYGSHC